MNKKQSLYFQRVVIATFAAVTVVAWVIVGAYIFQQGDYKFLAAFCVPPIVFTIIMAWIAKKITETRRDP